MSAPTPAYLDGRNTLSAGTFANGEVRRRRDQIYNDFQKCTIALLEDVMEAGINYDDKYAANPTLFADKLPPQTISRACFRLGAIPCDPNDGAYYKSRSSKGHEWVLWAYAGLAHEGGQESGKQVRFITFNVTQQNSGVPRLSTHIDVNDGDASYQIPRAFVEWKAYLNEGSEFDMATSEEKNKYNWAVAASVALADLKADFRIATS